MRQIFLFILLLFLLPACGKVYPIYSQNHRHNVSQLKQIEIISDNSSIIAAEFYDYMNELLTPNQQNKNFKLQVEFSNTSVPATILHYSDVVRDSVDSLVRLVLRDKTGKVILNDKFRLMSSFNTVYNAYSSYVEEEQIKINLAKLAAEEVLNRLILYFTTQYIEDKSKA